MKYLVGFLAKSIAFIIHIQPLWIRDRMGDFLGLLWYDILRIRRGIVLDNIKIAFPDLSDSERQKLARKSMLFFGRSLVDYCHLPFLDKNNFTKHIEVKSEHLLEEALLKNKGVCLLSLHLGNGDLGGAGLALSGMPVHLISKEFKLKWLNEMWFSLRKKQGMRFFSPRKSTQGIIKALAENEAVIFVLDQFMGPPIGVPVKFFGKDTGAAMGLSVIVRRKQSPVLPVFCYRKENGVQVVEFGHEIDFEEQENKESTLKYMTQKYTDKIEELVRKYPEQWMWVHRRWKIFK